MKNLSWALRRWVSIGALLVALAVPAWSQLSSGSILGTVSDSSGAVIPGVSVKITNPDVGLVRDILTNESGNFRVDQLPIGRYTVEVELTGFKKEIRSGVQLDIDQRLRVDFQLQPGQVTDVVEVSSEAPMVQTDDSSIGQVVEERKIVTLPLNGRNFSQLAYIVPGAFAPRPDSGLGNRGGFSVAGLNENTNQFLLDGINNNGTGTMEIAARINIDAVGEFKVQTGTYSAQYGRYAGAQVDVVTKSGTNNFHGTAFAFTRNDNVDARNVFDRYPLPNGHLPEFKRHQYGATVGGPIMKDKLFFFGGFQGQRQAKFITTAPSVPLPEFFTGNLSKMPQIARDPQTGQPFPGNIIPQNRLNPIAVKMAQFWPTPDRPGLSQNATALLPTPDNFFQPVARVDYNINQSHSLHGTYNFYNNNLLEWEIAGRPDIPGFMTDSIIKSQGLSISETWMLSTSTVNELRAGLGRVRRSRYQQFRDKNHNQSLGIGGTTADTEPLAYGVPYVTISGLSRIGDNTNMPQPRVDQTFTVADNFSWMRGNHSFKVGADWFLQQMNLVLISDGRGVFDFNGQGTGNAVADFLLGLPSFTRRQPPLGPLSENPRRTSINAYVQDDWKFSRNLTFNIGLRYEYTGHLREKYGKLSNFDPTLNGGKGGMILVGSSPRFDNAVATFKNTYPGLTIQRGANELFKNDPNNFAPRFGFAWAPGSKGTVVRGAYGVFYQIRELCFCAFYTQAPYSLSQRFSSTPSAPLDLSNPWVGSASAGAINMSALDPNMVNPYYQQWSLDIQRELIGGFVADASYVGKKGTHISRTRDLNQPLDRSVPNPVRPYQFFNTIAKEEGSANSNYNGLHLRGEKRTRTGSSLLLAYMWGKMIDDAGGSPMDSYNLRLERSLAQDDVRHRFSLSYILPLPFGPGQRFLQGMKGATRKLLADWEVSGIFRANTGSPYSPTMNIDVSRTRNNWDRPNLVGKPNKDAPTASSFWDKSAFATPAAGTFGTAGRNILIGPSVQIWDFSVLKRIGLTEHQRMEVRFEMFNFLNHPNYNTPVTNPVAGNFGVISSAADPRQIQFGLKYLF